jgi:hypothetical protein
MGKTLGTPWQVDKNSKRSHAQSRRDEMKQIPIIITVLSMAAPALSAPQAKTEVCGWLVLQGNQLVEQADQELQPSDPKPLPTQPVQAKAAYCMRDTMMSYVGDERVVKLGLPLVIRSGDKEGVLEANPTVLFNYHKVGDKYLPGKPQD